MWKITISTKTARSIQKLPLKVKKTLDFLISELKYYGPIRGDWHNFAKLRPNIYHCHLKKGKPTYVVVWFVVNKKEKHIEVTYAGTHENAPY